MEALDRKIVAEFPGSVVRKDLVKAVKGNAVVPTYVLEYLLGQYCATDDEETIASGIQTVRTILAQHYVHRGEAELVKSTIKEKGRHKVIDKITVSLNDKDDTYEAEFSNLGIKKVLVDPATVKAHPKLLVGGVWCICDVEYDHQLEARVVPWMLGSLKPIQLSRFDAEAFLAGRARFTTDEWIDLLVQSIGFNPAMFGRRDKLIQLIRLIPYCERNYNLIELGPKGTGKSHIYSEFSPHGMLISGGEVTAAKLFVNNAAGRHGRIGLVGYWDAVAFDEFAGKTKKPDKTLVDIMKNYMANKSFSRGGSSGPMGAEASMVFVGNTQHTVPYMLKHSDLFDELPASYHDSAFLDRIHHYIPGWEVAMIRGEMFSDGYGFVVDYIAEVLKHMRDQDMSDRYRADFTLSTDITTRDLEGIHKTFSGLMKILFPHDQSTKQEKQEMLTLAVEGRKRVKDQLVRMDATIPPVAFEFTDKAGNVHAVTTLEEREYPTHYHRRAVEDGPADTGDGGATVIDSPTTSANDQRPTSEPYASELLQPGHVSFEENQKGASYARILGPYLLGAHEITVTDPFLRQFHQLRNLMELVELVEVQKDPDDEVTLKVITTEHPELDKRLKQLQHLDGILESCSSAGIRFVVEFLQPAAMHDRDIVTDTGWKIILGRGLDYFQWHSGNYFDIDSRLQERRKVKPFSVTYVKVGD